MISLDFLYIEYANRYNECLFNKTVEKGTQSYVEISEDKLVSRPEIIKYLKLILQSDKDQAFYHMICEEYGCEKSTLTKIASEEVG